MTGRGTGVTDGSRTAYSRVIFPKDLFEILYNSLNCGLTSKTRFFFSADAGKDDDAGSYLIDISDDKDKTVRRSIMTG